MPTTLATIGSTRAIGLNKVNSQPAIARPAIIRRARHRARQFPASLGFCAALFLSLAVAAIPLHAAPPRQSLLNKPAPAFVRNDLNGQADSSARLPRQGGAAQLLGDVVRPLPGRAAALCRVATAIWPRRAAGHCCLHGRYSAPVRALVRKMQLDFPVVMGDAKAGKAVWRSSWPSHHVSHRPRRPSLRPDRGRNRSAGHGENHQNASCATLIDEMKQAHTHSQSLGSGFKRSDVAAFDSLMNVVR